MYRNIVLVGGNFNIPGCKERIEAEVRKLAPHHFNVEVHLPRKFVDCTDTVLIHLSGHVGQDFFVNVSG